MSKKTLLNNRRAFCRNRSLRSGVWKLTWEK